MKKENLVNRYGETALVTGASSGIGRAFARRLAEEGFSLVLVARNEKALNELAAELRAKFNTRVIVIAVDLTDEASAEQIETILRQKEATVDLLINNAGFGSQGLFHDLDGLKEVRMIDLNCRAPVALTSKFLPAMIARGRGALIFLSSIAGYQPTPWFSTYGATKAFNLMYGEALWAELKNTGIDVLVVSPGYTVTEFQQRNRISFRTTGGKKTPEEIVDRALRTLGKKPSFIPGIRNGLLAWSVRLTPRRLMANLAYQIGRPQ